MSRKLADLAQAEERRETVREAAADYLRGEWSLKRLRECIERDGVASAPDLWEGMRGLDWDQVEGTVDEGALGLGEFCAIVEETGRALAPTPLVPCVVARAILAGSGSTMTPSLPVLAQREPDRSTDRLRTSATVSAADGGFRLRGEKRFVPYGCEADLLIVPARGEDGGVELEAVQRGHRGDREGVAIEARDLFPVELDVAEEGPTVRGGARCRRRR